MLRASGGHRAHPLAYERPIEPGLRSRRAAHDRGPGGLSGTRNRGRMVGVVRPRSSPSRVAGRRSGGTPATTGEKYRQFEFTSLRQAVSDSRRSPERLANLPRLRGFVVTEGYRRIDSFGVRWVWTNLSLCRGDSDGTRFSFRSRSNSSCATVRGYLPTVRAASSLGNL
jgi:hypothetical protein